MKNANTILDLLKHYFEELNQLNRDYDRERQCVKIMNCVLSNFDIMYHEYKHTRLLTVIYDKCIEFITKGEIYHDLSEISLQIASKFESYQYESIG